MSTRSHSAAPNAEITEVVPAVEMVVMLLAAAGGGLAAAVMLPTWVPGLSASLWGGEPKAFWYLARTSGVVAYLLFWLSMVFGLLVSNKMARLWNRGPMAVDLHQFVTWLAIAFSIFHALILLGDEFIKATPVQVLVPFGYIGYKPMWVGVGQIAFYLALVVALSFYARKRIGYRSWRTLHYMSFILYLGLTLHGVFAGTDTALPGMKGIYAASSLCVYFLIIVRILDAVRGPHPTPNVAPRSAPPSSIAR